MLSPLRRWVFRRISCAPHLSYRSVVTGLQSGGYTRISGIALILGYLFSGAGFAQKYDIPLQNLAFEPNQGQLLSGKADFLARGKGYLLYLRPTEAILALKGPLSGPSHKKPLRMHLLGAATHAITAGLDPLPGRHNYYIGNDPAHWHTDIPTYAKVAASGVYPGIDLVYYGREGMLEYDFKVAAGIDPRIIRLGFDGADKLKVNPAGELIIKAGEAQLIQHAPYAYQDIAGKRVAVTARYALRPGGKIGFALGDYDRRYPLIIDPALSYSSYLGGSNEDKALAVATDTAGNIYVTGSTLSTDFPGADVTGTTFKDSGNQITNAFVTKISKTGAVVFSTYLGAAALTADTEGDAIAVTATGKIYVAGGTENNVLNPFPTKNAYRECNTIANQDAFVTVLNSSDGTLNYSTCMGGGLGDKALGIAVDSSGVAYVVGWTTSALSTKCTDTTKCLFPTTGNALQKTANSDPSNPPVNSFFFKLDPSQTGNAQLIYSTYLGTTQTGATCCSTYATAVALDASNNAYVAGWTNNSATVLPTAFTNAPGTFQATNNGGNDAFFYKLDTNTAPPSITYATFLGGSKNDSATGIAITSPASGDPDVYVAGQTLSSDFYVKNPLQGSYKDSNSTYPTLGDAFVTKFSSQYTVNYSTYLGGSGEDGATGIAVDSSTNRVYVTGSTTSTDFPIQSASHMQIALNRGQSNTAVDAFVTSLEPDGQDYHYSTYLGGSLDDRGYAIAATPTDKAYVVGITASPSTGKIEAIPLNFPFTDDAAQKTNNSGFGHDAFVTRIAPVADLSIRRGLRHQ